MGFKQSKTLARKPECKPALIYQSWAAVPQMQLPNGGRGVENLQLHQKTEQKGSTRMRHYYESNLEKKKKKQMKPMDCLTEAPVKMPRVAQKYWKSESIAG